jgi:hypothetical protein
MPSTTPTVEVDLKYPERRQHRVAITRNTEYHLRGEVVVGVRIRGETQFIDSHLALGRHILIPRTIHRGDHLWLESSEGEVLVTSAVDDVTRPARELITHYLPPSAV